MKVLPTLNIHNGRVVPALEPDLSDGRAALDVIATLLDSGCCRFALVDVDAARGQGNNRDLIGTLIRRIRQTSAKVCIQVGGGIRSSDQAQYFLDLGATWLLVGTVLHRYPMVVDQMLARFRDHLTASVDSRHGEVQLSGWGEPGGLRACVMAERIRERGFKRLLFVDIPIEPGAEPDFETARAICEHVHIPVFMGGSLRSRAHLAQAEEVRGLQGALVDALSLMDTPEMIPSTANPCA